MSSANSTLSGFRPEQSDLPQRDTQRHVRRSALEASLRRKQWHNRTPAGELSVLRPSAGLAGQRKRLAALPSEILNEIFVYLHRQYAFIALPIDRQDFPWNVAGVCSQWRQVVWGMPGAFDTIVIGKPHGSPSLGSAQVEAVGYMLSYILSLTPTLLVGMVVYPPFFSIPISYSHRIRELKLRFIDGESLSSLFMSPAGSFNHLEELDVKMEGGPWAVFPGWSFRVMPALQALLVDSSQDIFLRPALSLPWRRLTELEIADPMDPHNILDILSYSPWLIRSTFQVCGEVQIDIYPLITLPHLTFLSLSNCSLDLAGFLDPLTLPSLEELRMTDDRLGDDILDTWSHQPFTALIHRSHCLVRHLVLQPNQWACVSLAEDSIEPLLCALPAVKTLELPARIPSSTFVGIQLNKLLPELEVVKWMLDTAGVEQFTDWLLSFEVGGGHRLRAARASCHVGHRLAAAEKRFHARKFEIARAGIDAELSRVGQNGSCECQDGPEEDEDCPWF